VFWHAVLPAQDAANRQDEFAAEVRQVAPAPQLVLFFRAEAHALAFHIGRPINTFLEWENLDVWAGRPGPNYVLMPAPCADEWQRHVTAGALEEVLRQPDVPGRSPDRTLVLMRTRPRGTPPCPNPPPSPKP
jgi:hypothetical protein